MTTAGTPTHDELVASMTGGMTPLELPAFTGSDLLRADGRPHPEFRAELRKIPNVRNALTIASISLGIVLVILAVGRLDTWWAVLLGVAVVGNLQTRMYILHHEAAHRLLFSNRAINDAIGIRILGWLPLGVGTHHYRRGHANHHRDEFGPNEPDFLLYAFYPIPRASMVRKLLRDASGVSAYRILKPRFTGLMIAEYRGLSLRFFAGQVIVFAIFFALGEPLLYPLLWVLPYVTWYQVQNRLRSIGEHGGMTRSPDRRRTTHHVEQHWIARLLITPYSVGYHLAHHVDSGVPFRNLPRLHRALEDGGYIDKTITWPSYTRLWKSMIRNTEGAHAVG